VLERAGWRFIRIRSSRFYRDPEVAMAEVFEELRRLEVDPVGEPRAEGSTQSEGIEFRERVLARAWEIMREQGWIQTPTKTEAAPYSGHSETASESPTEMHPPDLTLKGDPDRQTTPSNDAPPVQPLFPELQ